MTTETVIFLDIDGVLTSARCNGFHDFDLWAVTFIRWACAKGNAKIVISSTWRSNKDAQAVFTKTFGEYLHNDWKTCYKGQRQDEIDDWLSKHPEVSNFIVIDDDIGDLKRHETKLIRTSSLDGMLTEHMMELRDRLGIKGFPHPYNPVFKDDVCFYTEREKETIKQYPVAAKFLD